MNKGYDQLRRPVMTNQNYETGEIEMNKGFIVVYDDECGYCVPFGWEVDCEGAICVSTTEPAFFATKEEARKAIKISTAFAKLQIAQGKPHNSDFIEDIKRVKIIPLVGIGGE